MSAQVSRADRERLLLRGGARWVPLLICVVAGAVFFGTLDQTVVVTVLPKIIDELALPVSRFGEATWIVNGYLLGYAVALPLAGAMADAYGHVRTFFVCLFIFACGSIAVALAPTVPTLAAARLVQALGGGGLLPVGMALAADALTADRRPLVFGLIAAANNGSSVLGPLWGAVLVGTVGWRGIFWLNLPLIMPVALVLFWLVRRAEGIARRPFDWPGALLLTVAIAAGTLALTDDGADPRPAALTLAFALTALAGLWLFVRRERVAAHPLLTLSSFRSRAFSAAMLLYFLIGAALIVALVDVPLMRNLLFGGTALDGGLDLMRLLLLLTVGGVVGGLLCTRLGYRATVMAGLMLAVGGFAIMRFWSTPPSSMAVWCALGLIGFGLGLCDAPIFSSVLEAAAPGERGAASGMLVVLWTCGMIAGLGLLGTQGLSSFSTGAARLFREQGPNLDPAAVQQLMRHTFNGTLIGAAGALMVALLLALCLQRRRSDAWRWTPLTGLEE